MNTIDAKILKEGMRFSSPLLFDDEKSMFLTDHKPVRKSHLRTIVRWNILHFLTQGKEIIGDDDSDDITELEEVEELEELEEVVAVDTEMNLLLREYLMAIKTMEKVFLDYKDGKSIGKATIDKMVKSIYQLINKDRHLVAGLVLVGSQKHFALAVSAVNSAIISVIMGLELSMPQRNLLHLLAAALLHDLDMVSVPDRIVNKRGRLTVEEFEILKVHPLKTVRTVTEVLMYPKEIAVILLQHHERWDGAGYPEGRRGQNINIAARILSVADAFEAMVSEKPYRNSMIAYDAVKNLLADKEKRFDPNILKVFIKSVGVYPVGSYVLLNDSSVAKVIECEPSAPFMPTIKIIISRGVAGAVNVVINLKRQKAVFISRAIDPNELTGA